MRKIFITGDTHDEFTRFNTRNFPEGRELTKDDIIFQLGDFGAIWSDHEISSEKYWTQWLIEKPWTTFIILGNHEGYDRIMELPETTQFGAKCWEYKTQDGSLYFVKAGEIMTIDGETFLCIRGALSIDKAYRTEGRSWWPQEMLSATEETNTLDNLDKIGWKVDWLLTHTTADSCVQGFLDNPNSEKFNDPVSRFLEFIANRLEFKGNLFGHFHNTRTYIDSAGDYYRCFYHDIINLEDVRKDQDAEKAQNDN